MGSFDSPDSKSRLKRPHLLIVGVVLLVALFSAVSVVSQGHPQRSVEARFTDASASHLKIVPASCPSDPHFQGDCTTSPPPPASNTAAPRCVLTAPTNAIVAGGNVTLGWNSSQASTLGGPISWTSASITSIGSVTAGAGSVTVSPSRTTTYTLSESGTSQSFCFFGFCGNTSADTAVCFHTIYVCAAGQAVQNGQCVAASCPAGFTPGASGQCVAIAETGGKCTASYFCSGSDLYFQTSSCSNQLVQHCGYGCASGSCIAPVPAVGSIAARPSLVKSGATTDITWNSSNTVACSVSAPNGDAWTGLTGDQKSLPITALTTYTLTCTGKDGSTLVKDASVYMLPSWIEN